MASPVPDSYSAASGATIYGGRAASSANPAWMVAAGVALNKLVVIPGSTAAGTPAANSGIFAYSGLTVKRDTSELFSVANGGHSDSADNGVYSFGPKGVGLMADSPTWIQRCAPTPSPVQNILFQSDGKPTSRHSYDRHHYAAGKIHVIGGTGLHGTAVDDNTYRYEYDPASDTWGAPVTFTGGYGAGVDHANGLIFRAAAIQTWNPLTDTLGPAPTLNGTQIRFPLIVANDIGIAFCLQFGNGFTSSSTAMQASKITLGTRIQSTITFNASAAYTQFLSDALIPNPLDGNPSSVVPGMDYDDANGVFYWYQGQAGQVNNLYVIRPNSGNVWDMSLFSFASGSVTMTTCVPSGLCGRLKYMPLLKGIVIYPTGGALAFANQPMYFLKTSA